MAEGTVIRIATKSVINAQNAFLGEYKRGKAAKRDLPYVHLNVARDLQIATLMTLSNLLWVPTIVLDPYLATHQPRL